MRFFKITIITYIVILFILYNMDLFTPSATKMVVVGEWNSDSIVMCGTSGKINDKNTVYIITQGVNKLSGHSMLRVLNIYDQGTPQEIGSLKLPISLSLLNAPRSINLSGNLLYVPIVGSIKIGLWIVDISNPESPEEIAFLETQYAPNAITLSGNLMCLSTSPPGTFLFYDISDPNKPQHLGSYTLNILSDPNIQLIKDLLYVADNKGIYVIDVSTISSPKKIGYYSNSEWEGLPVVSLVCGEPKQAGLQQFLDIASPPGSFLDMEVLGQYAYVAASDSGLKIVDISNQTANPPSTNPIVLPDRAVRVATSDNKCYVLGIDQKSTDFHLSYSIYQIDVSDVTNPKKANVIQNIKGIPPNHSLMIGCKYIYFLNHKTLYVIKITN